MLVHSMYCRPFGPSSFNDADTGDRDLNMSIVEGQIPSSLLVRPPTFRGAPESVLLVFCRGRGLVSAPSYESVSGFIGRVIVELEGFFKSLF